MKLRPAFLGLFLTSALFFIATPVLAQSEAYQKAEQTYLSRVDAYRTARDSWLAAKKKNQDFKTLTSESAAITAARNFELTQVDIANGYLDLIIEKANSANSLSSSDKQIIVDYYRTEKAYYDSQKSTLYNAETTAQISAVGMDIDDHYRNKTLTQIPFIKTLIASSDYSVFLEQVTIIYSDTKSLVNNNTALGEATKKLIGGWISDTDVSITASRNLAAGLLKNLDDYKNNTRAVKDPKSTLSHINEDLKTLHQNLSENTANIIEILGRLKND
ncbi:MAG: hypothetical protein NT141_00630 [candidate division WWE3 bacterium]|nr:hypothetical protein [candidate division WWE3 bacterium]